MQMEGSPGAKGGGGSSVSKRGEFWYKGREVLVQKGGVGWGVILVLVVVQGEGSLVQEKVRGVLV